MVIKGENEYENLLTNVNSETAYFLVFSISPFLSITKRLDE
jgi:hypothetical protein